MKARIHFVLSFLLISLAPLAMARPRTCGPGGCGNQINQRGGRSCSSGLCGNQNGLTGISCRNGTCGALNQGQFGPFQQGQFVNSPTQVGVPQQIGQTGQTGPGQTGQQGQQQTGTQAQTVSNTGTGVQNANGQQAPSKPSLPSVAGNLTSGNTKFTVINPEPTELSRYGENNGKKLNHLLISPSAPLSAKMRSKEYEDGIMRTFLVDPNTGEAYGETPDGPKKFDFNDAFEKLSLIEVKEYLVGKGLDDTLRKFLAFYWPKEELRPEHKKQPEQAQTQVADNKNEAQKTADSGDAARHASSPTETQTASKRPEAPAQEPQAQSPTKTANETPTREVVQNQPTQARAKGIKGKLDLSKMFGKKGGNADPHADDPNWICDGKTCRPRTAADGLFDLKQVSATDEDLKDTKETENAKSPWRVTIKIFKSPGYCHWCNVLAGSINQIKGQDNTTWWVGGKGEYPITDVVIENGKETRAVQSVAGADVPGINTAIQKARQMANRLNNG